MNEERERREQLYITRFMRFLDTIPSPAKRDWSSLEEKFKAATGLDITSGLGAIFKGFVLGMEDAERVLVQINEYARSGGN